MNGVDARRVFPLACPRGGFTTPFPLSDESRAPRGIPHPTGRQVVRRRTSVRRASVRLLVCCLSPGPDSLLPLGAGSPSLSLIRVNVPRVDWVSRVDTRYMEQPAATATAIRDGRADHGGATPRVRRSGTFDPGARARRSRASSEVSPEGLGAVTEPCPQQAREALSKVLLGGWVGRRSDGMVAHRGTDRPGRGQDEGSERGEADREPW